MTAVLRDEVQMLRRVVPGSARSSTSVKQSRLGSDHDSFPRRERAQAVVDVVVVHREQRFVQPAQLSEESGRGRQAGARHGRHVPGAAGQIQVAGRLVGSAAPQVVRQPRVRTDHDAQMLDPAVGIEELGPHDSHPRYGQPSDHVL